MTKRSTYSLIFLGNDYKILGPYEKSGENQLVKYFRSMHARFTHQQRSPPYRDTKKLSSTLL